MREPVKNRIDHILGMIREDGIVRSYPTSAMVLLRFIRNCEVMTYRDLAEKKGATVEELCRFLGSPDGCTIYQRSRDRYLICVNTDRMSERLRWTVAHELGHVLAGHFQEITESRLPKRWYFETEADYFAASFLAPFPEICACRIATEEQLQKTFGLSRTAARYRWREYQESGWGWKDRSRRTARRARPVNIWPEDGERYSL